MRARARRRCLRRCMALRISHTASYRQRNRSELQAAKRAFGGGPSAPLPGRRPHRPNRTPTSLRRRCPSLQPALPTWTFLVRGPWLRLGYQSSPARHQPHRGVNGSAWSCTLHSTSSAAERTHRGPTAPGWNNAPKLALLISSACRGFRLLCGTIEFPSLFLHLHMRVVREGARCWGCANAATHKCPTHPHLGPHVKIAAFREEPLGGHSHGAPR